jgi:RNA polymerase sigma factor for flagellar operon FliA
MMPQARHRDMQCQGNLALAEASQRNEILLEHMSQIRYIAQRISAKLPASVELDDLISAGMIGLIDALDKYDPSRGVKFKTYAELRVRGAILDSLRNLDWAPRSLRKKRKGMERVASALEQELGRPATETEIAQKMDLSVEELQELKDQVQGINLGNFHEIWEQDENGNRTESALFYLPDDPEKSPFVACQREEVKRIIASVIDRLPDNERLVLSLYYFEELTMKEIGKILGVNESRVSQLHTKATMRLRVRLEKSLNN